MGMFARHRWSAAGFPHFPARAAGASLLSPGSRPVLSPGQCTLPANAQGKFLKHPNWVANLESASQVRVMTAGSSGPARRRAAAEGFPQFLRQDRPALSLLRSPGFGRFSGAFLVHRGFARSPGPCASNGSIHDDGSPAGGSSSSRPSRNRRSAAFPASASAFRYSFLASEYRPRRRRRSARTEWNTP